MRDTIKDIAALTTLFLLFYTGMYWIAIWETI